MSTTAAKVDSRAEFLEKKRAEREQRKARALRESSAITLQVSRSLIPKVFISHFSI